MFPSLIDIDTIGKLLQQVMKVIHGLFLLVQKRFVQLAQFIQGLIWKQGLNFTANKFL